ncbi:hypothetical protein [Dactylosporangium sp. NPDC049140]|uniref:hypothetical protein n=1 Tax=Dactylosporangium sp. NPDC049140 TaxID=3155647 RepID=UPI0033EF5DB8
MADVTAAFGLGPVRSVDVLAAGTMNRSWRVTAAGGVAAVKEVLDVDVAAAVGHRLCGAGWPGLPVPAPLSTSGRAVRT